MRGKKTSFWLSLIITALFAGFGALFILNHEIVVSETFSIWPRLGFSYTTGSFISLALVSLAVFALLKFSRFKLWQKILLIFSAGFWYFPYINAGFGIGTFIFSPKMDYLEFSKELNESLFGMLIPIFELGLVFLLIYLYARYLKLFFFALISFASYLSLLYFVAPAPLSSEMTAPLLALATLFIALTFSAKRRGRNRFDQIFGRLEIMKLIRSYTSVRTLCLIFVFFSIPCAVFASVHDLINPVSNANLIAERLNEFPENAVILPASIEIENSLEMYAPLLSGGRELYKTPVTDENLEEVLALFPDNITYIIYSINACGNNTTALTIKDDWSTEDFFDETKNAQMGISEDLVRATGLEPAQLKIATTTSR